MSISGLSRAHLMRMYDVMSGSVERGEVPGLVKVVSRRGEVHVDLIICPSTPGLVNLARSSKSLREPLSRAQ